MSEKIILLIVSTLTFALLLVSPGCGSGDTVESRRPTDVIQAFTGKDSSDGGNNEGDTAGTCIFNYFGQETCIDTVQVPLLNQSTCLTGYAAYNPVWHADQTCAQLGF